MQQFGIAGQEPMVALSIARLLRLDKHGMVELRLSSEIFSSISALEYVELEIPQEVAQTIAWAIQGILEGYADNIRKECNGTG